jgi:hypothetical protein
MQPVSSMQPYVISDVRKLDAFGTWRVMFTHMGPVCLKLDGLGHAESNYLQGVLNRSVPACGCKEGAIGLVVLTGAYFARLISTGSAAVLTGWSAFYVGVGFAFVGAVVGKAVGIMRARASRKKTIRRIRTILRSPVY